MSVFYRNLVKISRNINSVKGWLRWNNGDIFFERPHRNGLWNGWTWHRGEWGRGGGNQKYAGFEDHVVIFSLLSFFSFPFSPLRTTQTSKAVLSTVMLICRRCQSILHCRRLNRPWYWICPRNQWRLEASTNPAMRDFCREPFRINIESFQALCRILSIFMFSFRSSSLPMENYVASGLLRLSNVSSCCSCCLPDAMFISLCTYFSYVKQHSPHTPRWLTHFATRTMHGTGKRPLTWV